MRAKQWIGIWAVGGLILVSGSRGLAQQTTNGGSSSGTGVSTQSPTLPPIFPPDSGMSPDLRQEQAKLRNLDRQKQLVSDTEKLLALANELKVDVDKTNQNTLSIDVVKKADEIEKLAHSVKEKMKGD